MKENRFISIIFLLLIAQCFQSNDNNNNMGACNFYGAENSFTMWSKKKKVLPEYLKASFAEEIGVHVKIFHFKHVWLIIVYMFCAQFGCVKVLLRHVEYLFI